MLHDGHFDMVLEFSSSAAAAAFGIEGAEDDSAKAIKLHRKRRVPAEQYLDLSNSGVSLFRSAVSQLFETRESKDAFGVRKGLGELERATKFGKAADAAVAHSALLNKLDTSLTMLQKAQGDPAEILHNILWRRDLYDRVPQLQKTREHNGCARAVRAVYRSVRGMQHRRR